MKLEGKRVVVTGSSMGIGQAVAVRLAKEGARVVINARGEAALEETAALIRQAGGEVVASCGSVADYDYCGQLIQTCVEQFGAIDGLVNCAGIVEPQGSSIVDIPEQDWRQLIDIHLHGTFNTCRHAAPLMVKQGYGRIINTGSHAFLGVYGGTGYAAGKGATNSFSSAIAMDLAEHNVQVNVVCPGGKTRMSTGDDYEAQIADLHKRGLLNDFMAQKSLSPPDPAHVAGLYAFLLSDAASEITGRVFWGSGGMVGVFHKNADQMLAMRDHEVHPPWSVDELEQKLDKPWLKGREKLYNVLGNMGILRLALKQEFLMKLAGLAARKK